MPRKISREAVNAFLNCKDYKNSNTEVRTYENFYSSLRLHGNQIAEFYTPTNTLKITLAGWNTPTTRERLNAIPGVHVTTKKGQAYLNGEKWDGNSIAILFHFDE